MITTLIFLAKKRKKPCFLTLCTATLCKKRANSAACHILSFMTTYFAIFI